jgi:hypothetical protein
MIFLIHITFNKCLVNNAFLAFFPIMTNSSHPTQNGVLWVTNDKDLRERESTDSKKYENPINVKHKTPVKYVTPERNRRVEDTITMHTTDLMSILKSSVIKSHNESSIFEQVHPKRSKTPL